MIIIEYTIKKVAELAGISTRTLRYYDEINLLTPARITISGYRIYGSNEIDRLQLILFYRSLDLSLEEISALLDSPEYDAHTVLAEHYQKLLEKKIQLDMLIHTVQNTLNYQEGKITMTDEEKFFGLKQQQIQENEQLYGSELRQKYGTESLQATNQQWLSLSKDEMNALKQTEQILLDTLKTAVDTKDHSVETMEKIFETHKSWLNYTTPAYSSQLHQSLGLMYVHDPRFTAYYESQAGKGAAALLNDSIQHFLNS